MRWAVLALALLATPAAADVPVVVDRVIDGDTLVTTMGTRIRLFGIDAPERNEIGGSAATSALRGWIEGRTIVCRQVDVDRYSRVVAICYREGADIGGAMISAGLAREYCRYSRNRYRTC